MFETISKLLQKLLESYLELFNIMSQQHKSFTLLIFRASIIMNGLQELQLIAENALSSDTKAFYSNIKQFIITNQMIKNVSEATIFQLLIVHIILNLIVILGLLVLRKKDFSSFTLFIIILIENYILIYPTLYSIFQITDNASSYIVYITSIFNFVMYFQLFLTKYSWRQTILLEMQGLIQNGNALLEILIQLIIILSVGFLRISKYGSFIFLILKQIIKFLIDIHSFNFNSQFLIYHNVIQTIMIFSLCFNFSMIYTFIIGAFSLQITYSIRKQIFQSCLYSFEISIHKCQIYELLFKYLEKTQKIVLLQEVLKNSFNSNINQKSNQKNKGKVQYFTSQIDLLEKLIQNTHYQDQSLIQIYCNYDVQVKPLKTVILFMRNYKIKNYYDQAYASVQQKLLNYIISQNQQLLSNKYASINIMDNKTFVNALVLSAKSLKEIENVIQSKIDLLEGLRKGFIQQIDVLDQVETYTKQVFSCKQFIVENYDIKQFILKDCSNQDILTFRILQLYYGIVLNDLKTSKALGKCIEDLLKADKVMQDTTINNQIIQQNRFLLLQTSLINQRGKLVNLNKKQISYFFNCPIEYLQDYQYIYELMPDFIAQIHDELIDSFIESGYSQLLKIGKISFLLDPQSFIIPIYVHLYNPSFNNDFTLYSIISMQVQQQEYLIFDTEGRILGISRKFFEFTKAHRNQKEEINVFDIVHRGSSILYYMPFMASTIQDLKQNIDNQASNSVNNVRSYWHYPDNHFECMTQTQTLINYSQRFELENQQIYGQNIKLLDKNFQNCFINAARKKQKENEYIDNQIEVLFSLHTYVIKNYFYFMIAIREYKVADFTKTYTSNSLQQVQNPLNSFSTKFTQLDNIMSERQLTTDNGTIQDIKQFSTFQHTQILEKLFKDEDMSGRFVVDISQKNQINISHSQTKLPFLSSRLQLSQRQLLSAGLNGVKIIQPQFHLPSIDSKKKVEDSQLYELEEEMRELEILESIRKDQIMQIEQDINNQKKVEFNQYDSNVNEESLKVSEKQNDTQIQILMQKQIQQGSQLQMIQEIVNFNGSMKMVNLGYVFNFLLTLWVFIMIFVNSKIVDNEMETYFTQIASSISYQSLLFYLGIPYTVYQQLYVNNRSIIEFSPALLKNTQDKISFFYAYSQIQQSPFQTVVCSDPQYYSKYFEDINSCTNYFIQFQSYMTIKYKDFILNGTIEYDTFSNNSFYKKESFYSCQKLVDILDNFVKSFNKVKINDIFIILLLLNMFVTVLIFLAQFKIGKSKTILKAKFYSVLHRLSYNEIVELIARFSCFKLSISENSWKLVSYYDLITYDDQTKEKINQNNHKKYSQLNEEKLQKKGDIVQILAITFAFFSWILFFILNFVLFYVLFENFAPSFKIAQSFVAFKQKLDFSLILGFWIKTDPLLGIYRNASEQAEIIQEYFNITESLQGLLDDISFELVQSTYLDDQKMKTILDTLNSDLCPSYQYQFCYPEKLSTLPYFPSESFATLLVGGATGFVAQIYKFTVSEFSGENSTLRYSNDLEMLKTQVNEQIFKNIYIQYIQDIQYTMYTLFSEFNDGNAAAGQKLLSYINYYQYGLGISLIVLYNIIDFIRIRYSIQELKQLKFILLVLPEQKFENQIIKQKITDISKYFF